MKHRAKKGSDPGSREDKYGEQNKSKKKRRRLDSYHSWIWIAAIGLAVAVVHSAHLHLLFENDRYFSHLSKLERELSFRTEMGLYYSYFKTVIEAPSFFSGIDQILHDNHTEYPSTINTLQRFNLYPEVVLGGTFRIWRAILSAVESSGVQCFTISRGMGQPPVTACNGLGDPADFYIFSVFSLNGAMAGVMFFLGAYLSNHILGGLLSILLFLFNHGEATRVMWTPPLRESFAMPFFLVQMLILTHCIRHSSALTLVHYGSLVAASLAFLLPWQFSQFVVVTQVLSLFLLHCLRILPSSGLRSILWALSLAFLCNLVLQFGNRLLLTSLLPSSLLSCILLLQLEKLFDYIPWRLLKMCAEVGLTLLLMLLLKALLTVVTGGVDDAHIGAILLSKLSSYRDFHTQLYTCSPEFDILPVDYAVQLSATLLLPAAVGTIAILAVTWYRHLTSAGSPDWDSSTANPALAEQTYHVLQCGAFAVLALLIMRLKLLLTTQLCILVALLARAKFQSKVSCRLLVCLLLVGASFKGVYNVWQQWSIVGEFNDPSLEELVTWVNGSDVGDGAVFAGAMPTMAALRLSTTRPVVNHPHYEDAKLRERTVSVYSVYSRQPPAHIHQQLSALLVTHVVVEEPWCNKRYHPGCSFAEVWDEIDPGNKDRPQFCQLILQTIPQQFELVFSNSIYRVLKLL